MFAPTSIPLLVLLVLLAAGLVVSAIRVRRWAVRIPAAILAVVLPFLAGIGTVNAYYGYYRTWHDLISGMSGTTEPGLVNHPVVATGGTAATVLDDLTGKPGRLLTVDLPGARSGIDRSGYVYLPPEFGDKRFATDRLPVVELLHGTPGRPADWINGLHVAQVMDQLRSQHLVGPMVLVLVDTNGGPSHAQECVDAVNGPKDDTYVSADVPDDLRRTLGLQTDARSWGLLGYSSGGYCAANLALRHRDTYHAAGVLDGYFSPEQGGFVQRLFAGDRAAELANDPMRAVLGPQPGPVPAFFIAAGTGTNEDLVAAQQFVAALGPSQHPQFLLERHASHDFQAWQASLPPSLSWLWGQLATPELHQEFPQAAGAAQVPAEVTLPAPPPPPPARPSSRAPSAPAPVRTTRAPTFTPTPTPTLAPHPTTSSAPAKPPTSSSSPPPASSPRPVLSASPTPAR